MKKYKDFYLPTNVATEIEEKEKERKRKYEEELMKGPQHWWENWEYSDYKKLMKEKRKLEEELAKFKKKENLRKGKNVK